MDGAAVPASQNEHKRPSGKRIVHGNGGVCGRASPIDASCAENSDAAIGHANVGEMKKGRVKVVNDASGVTYRFDYSHCGGGFNFEEGVHPLFRDQTRNGIGSDAISYHDAMKCARKHFNPHKVKIDLSNHAEESDGFGCPKFKLGSKTARGRVERTSGSRSQIGCLVSDKDDVGAPAQKRGGRARPTMEMPATKTSVGTLFNYAQ